MNTKTNDELVAEIHDEFYSADERLLQEAKNLLANPKVNKAIYAERLNKIGFGASKPVKEALEIVEAHGKAGEIIKKIEYFRVWYPSNKFITEDEVKKICEKYGLLLGDAQNYIGDVPEKNLTEIEKFSLRKEDWTEKALSYSFRSFTLDMFSGLFNDLMLGHVSIQSRRSGALNDYYRRVNESIGLIPSLDRSLPMMTSSFIDPFVKEKTMEPAKEMEQASFKICAPQKDFNTGGYEVKEGYRLVYDPVVLQPVNGGYLIVTAWGKESEDEIVINHNQN